MSDYLLGQFPSTQPWFSLRAKHSETFVPGRHPVIQCFYRFEVEQPSGATLAVPDGCVDMVFNCDDLNPGARICGSPLKARNSGLIHRHRYFGVRFHIGLLPAFLNMPADEILDHELNLLEVLPELEPLIHKVCESDYGSQVMLLERFFRGIVSRPQSAVTTLVMQKLCRAEGNLRIKVLENETGYSARTLQRRFSADTGMSPKQFGQIIRCQSAISRLNKGEESYAELALALGYSDQPHFLREFKKLVAATPHEFRQYFIKNNAA